MAIVNLTDDSFSGDGTGSDLDAATRRAIEAAGEGADIIDLGAESARADVPAREPEQEAQIIAAATERIGRETALLVSVDTYKPAVASAAFEAGASFLNDIGGLRYDAGIAREAARYEVALVVNFTRERPKVRPASPPVYGDLIAEHLDFLRARIGDARDAGVGDESIIVDPGIAFGKSHDEDLAVLRRLGEFRSLGRPILVAASRKHFIGSVTGLPPSERDEATAAVTALNIAYGADIVRVHDVRTTVRAVRIADAIVRGRTGDFAPTPDSWPWSADAEPIAGTTIERRK